MSGGGYPKFKNDRGVPEIRIGVKEFMCIGESPPQDHPHIYINMGEADTILCPYCATRFGSCERQFWRREPKGAQDHTNPFR
jgi:uncharacterized Zn-finger protein